MRNVNWMNAAVFAGLLFSAGPSLADGAPPRTAQASAPTPGDRAFLARALAVNQTEILLGRMASKRGTTPEVRATGDKMVERHTELARQLRELAQVDPAAEPPTLTADQQKTIARLAATSASEFDRSFKDTVDAGHVDELAMYREQVRRSADPRLSALAAVRVAALERAVASASPATNLPAKKADW